MDVYIPFSSFDEKCTHTDYYTVLLLLATQFTEAVSQQYEVGRWDGMLKPGHKRRG